jgi:hypothetical protein
LEVLYGRPVLQKDLSKDPKVLYLTQYVISLGTPITAAHKYQHAKNPKSYTTEKSQEDLSLGPGDWIYLKIFLKIRSPQRLSVQDPIKCL